MRLPPDDERDQLAHIRFRCVAMHVLIDAIDKNVYETLVLVLVKRSQTMTVSELHAMSLRDLYVLAEIVSAELEREAIATENALAKANQRNR